MYLISYTNDKIVEELLNNHACKISGYVWSFLKAIYMFAFIMKFKQLLKYRNMGQDYQYNGKRIQ